MGQLETAKTIWNYLVSEGWSKTAVAALLGNVQSESGVIADIWQDNNVGNMSGGYGLVQWTPATKYINWANSNGLNYKDIISQCKRIEWEVVNNQQFICPFMTFQQFKTSDKTPEELANLFLEYYEIPKNLNQPARAQQARYWYNELSNFTAELTTRVKIIDWFNKHRGHLTYWMYGSRNGADGTADCSGSITAAVSEVTNVPYDYLYSTVTLGGYLARCGYNLVLVGDMRGATLNQIQDEDIILLSKGNSMADSGGAGGHTGVVSGDGKYITSTCYYTHGEKNTAIQDFELDANYLAANHFNYYEIWRSYETSYHPSSSSIQFVNSAPRKFSTNVHYCLRVLGGAWLSEITNFNDTDSYGFSGLPRNQHDMLYIKVDEGTLRYRVHTIQSGWLNWISKGDPNDFVNGCAGNPGETIDGVQIYYITPAGETLSQAYYRSQTAYRPGWLNICCDDGTSISGYDGWAGLLGEPLDRLQVGIATANPFSTYVAGDDFGYYTAATEENTTPTVNTTLAVDVDNIINDSVHDVITEMPIFSQFSKVEFKSGKTYGPLVVTGVDLWITTSADWTIKGNKGAYFSFKNGKINVNASDIVGDMFPGFVGTLEYLNFAKKVEKYASLIKDGAIVFSIARRNEEAGCPGTKITFQYKTKKENQEVKTEISFELYFKQVPGSPVSYPVEDYNSLWNMNDTFKVAIGIGLVAIAVYFAPEEIIALAAGDISQAVQLFKFASQLVKESLG